MKDLLKALQGKKTKIQGALLVLMGVGEALCNQFGGTFSFPEWAYVILGGGAAMSIRAGVQRQMDEIAESIKGKK